MNLEKYTQNAQGAIMDCQNIAIEEGHQQLDGARRIAVHMDIQNNRSESFRQFVSGVRRIAHACD